MPRKREISGTHPEASGIGAQCSGAPSRGVTDSLLTWAGSRGMECRVEVLRCGHISTTMCLILTAVDSHPDYSLVVAANRDEFYDRPTLAAAFWPEHPTILGGRDL